MKYYLINNKIMKGSEMPKNIQTDKIELSYDMKLKYWKDSLQPCEISESELDKIIKNRLNLLSITQETYSSNNPIEVTDTISDNNGVITFKDKDSEHKITSQKYAAKIVEVAFFERIPNKETICNVVTALIDEYANNKVEEFKVEQAKFLIENFSNKQVDGGIEAFEFAEWMIMNGYSVYKNVFKQHPLSNKEYNSKQLYEIFKNRK